MPGTVPSDQDYIDPRRDIVSCAVFGEFDPEFPAVVFYILSRFVRADDCLQPDCFSHFGKDCGFV